MNTFRGVIAFENRETEDGRILEPGVIPLDPRRGRPRHLYQRGGTPLGIATDVWRDGDGICASGRVDLDPGEYGVGIDLTDFEVDVIDDLMIVTSGRILGVCVYVDDGEPAWPGVQIKVVAE